ncbi:MAG: GAF domain-containing protein [Chloroflexi bacterium]|nr:GAF domain-containing protein [Chloroflexota bacterium]
MTKSKENVSALKEACQITGANWAACIERDSAAWKFESFYKLSQKRRAFAENYFNLGTIDNWLYSASAEGKSRSRKIPEGLDLGAIRLYIFPIRGTEKVVLAGAEKLGTKEKRIWQLLANSGSFSHGSNFELKPADSFIFGGQAAIPYDLSGSLERILARVVQYISCDKAWLAVYSDGVLKVEANWHFSELLGEGLSLDDGNLLSEIRETSKSILVERSDPEWESIPAKIRPDEAEVWAALPLKTGQRQVGIVALSRDEPFSEDEWLKLQQFSLYAAASVEIFVTFSEMANHLKRQAMLNDFALIVSSAQNLSKIVRRVFALLERIFGTEALSLFLLSSDARTLREYRNNERRIAPRTEFVKGHPVERFISDGKNARLENVAKNDYRFADKETQSALLVPLKYRGDVIGILTLESKVLSAFSGYDENLLVVIASHLAGLVEYGRLREEAEARARNLGLIHEVIQQVIGLTNVNEVAQITADLLVKHFSYELAVLLLEDRYNNLNIAGISGKASSLVKSAFENFEYPNKEGISGMVFATGESIMVDDVSKEPMYKAVPEWEVGSEICVALRDGDRILGIIDVESSTKNAFTHNDLLALESLAGFLTSAISGVDRYQMLQDTIQILQTTQNELHERMEAQRAAENRLVQAAKLAAVGEMAAGVAHELNNPLTTVAGFSELVLADLSPDAPQREDLEMVLREAKRARSVVRRLLDFARQSESVRIRADLNEVVEDVVALTNHLMQTSQVDFEMNIGKDLPWVLIDRDQIKQVVLNLLHNAIHAMPNGGKLFLQTEERENKGEKWITMSIRDTGKGITADELGRIFEPFFTTKADDGGTGLGLAVSYGIITDHEGFIDVDSTPNEGASFTVWLPIEEKH